MVSASSDELRRAARVYKTNADACRALGISAHTFRRLCEEHGVETPSQKSERQRQRPEPGS